MSLSPLAELRRSPEAMGRSLTGSAFLSCRNLPVLVAEETQKTRSLLEEVAQLRAQIRSLKVILHFGEGGLAGQNP